MTFKQLSPFHVACLWHWLEPGIRSVAEKCPNDFTPKDVYWFLRENRATAFLILEDGEMKGLFIAEILTDVFRGHRTLSVWIMHYHGAMRKSVWVREELKQLARVVNCSGLEFKSPLKGWERVAVKEGFRLKMNTWRVDLG